MLRHGDSQRWRCPTSAAVTRLSDNSFRTSLMLKLTYLRYGKAVQPSLENQLADRHAFVGGMKGNGPRNLMISSAIVPLEPGWIRRSREMDRAAPCVPGLLLSLDSVPPDKRPRQAACRNVDRQGEVLDGLAENNLACLQRDSRWRESPAASEFVARNLENSGLGSPGRNRSKVYGLFVGWIGIFPAGRSTEWVS